MKKLKWYFWKQHFVFDTKMSKVLRKLFYLKFCYQLIKISLYEPIAQWRERKRGVSD